MANHLIDGSEAKLCHDGSKLIRNVVKEVNDMLWSSLEFLAKLRVLSRDTDRASVQMHFLKSLLAFVFARKLNKIINLPHHDTAHSNQWSCGESPFLCPK